MCGIAGIFAYHYAAPKVDREELICVRDHMIARGPDGKGEWFSQDRRVGLAHRRLAIIDLSENGAQPMANQDASLVISFNGEIYNYRELRKNLEQKGYRFKSNSDTEVLLHLYAEKGEAMVHDLRGMFAFLLWDEKKKSLWMVRDPYGIKPLYYANDGWTVRAASQVKAILTSPKVSKTQEPAGVVGFFLWGNVPEPFTMYQEIRSVPAGSYVWVNELGVSKPTQYFSIAEVYTEAASQASVSSPNAVVGDPVDSRQKHAGMTMKESGDDKGAEAFEQIREALKDSVNAHFISDVPVGLFLSSGIDSGMLAGLSCDLGKRNVQAVTLGFEEFQGSHDDEIPLAAKAALQYQLEHKIYKISRKNFQRELPRIFEAMDQPTVDGVNTYFVSKAAHELGMKVALTGLGGDELFGGYDSFRQIPLASKALKIPSRIPFLPDMFCFLCDFLKICGLPLHPKAREAVRFGKNYSQLYFLKRGLFMPRELPLILDRNFVREGLRRLAFLEGPGPLGALGARPHQNPFAKIAALESSLYMKNQLLRDADWAGMAHSVEIRTPLVDSHLLKAVTPVALRFPRFQNKLFLGEVPELPLPREVVERDKTGFVVPIQEWIKEKISKVDGLSRDPWIRHWARKVASHSAERIGSTVNSPQTVDHRLEKVGSENEGLAP